MRPGDIIPADTKLLAGELAIGPSALTGESKDAHKAPEDALYSGSVVRRAEGNGVFMLTGCVRGSAATRRPCNHSLATVRRRAIDSAPPLSTAQGV